MEEFSQTIKSSLLKWSKTTLNGDKSNAEVTFLLKELTTLLALLDLINYSFSEDSILPTSDSTMYTCSRPPTSIGNNLPTKDLVWNPKIPNLRLALPSPVLIVPLTFSKTKFIFSEVTEVLDTKELPITIFISTIAKLPSGPK